MVEIPSASLPRDPSAPPRSTGPARAIRRRGSIAAALVLALLVASSATTGCMVMDELDSAAAKMPTSDKKPATQPAPGAKTQTPAERLAAAKSAVQAHSKQWWQQAKTMTPGQRPAGVVQCRLGDGVRFMAKDDCIVLGGKPVDGAG